MDYKFYLKTKGKKRPPISSFPAFVLEEMSADDIEFRTQFLMYYYTNQRNKTEIGPIKILQKGKMETKLPMQFSKLSRRYCSLGQSNTFYQKLYQLFTMFDISSILNSLNDITQSKVTYRLFKNEFGFQESLFRNSEAQKAFKEVPQLLSGKKTNNSFRFEFSTQIPGFPTEHSVNFSFNKKSQLPRRIAAIIGKNGSGKTQYLARLASSLSGLAEKGTFSKNTLPPFSRVIAVSYSLFDRFERPRQSKAFSYYFCGFQSEKEFDSIYGIERRLNRAFREISEFERLDELKEYLIELLGKEITELYFNEIRELGKKRYGFLYDDKLQSKLSSGQIMMIIILTEIVAYITPESVLLFDEPETHIHPNAISVLIGVVSAILRKHDSFAVIATHSPQIIQEIPSSLIYKFDTDKTNPPVEQLSIETFGEDLTTITEKVFDTLDVSENYKKVIRSLSKRFTKDELLQLFEKDGLRLSMNARIYIEYLYIGNEKS